MGNGEGAQPIGAAGVLGDGQGGGGEVAGDGIVSLRAEVPEALLRAMGQFIEQHPNWDQYRLFQAALAGFLVQQGLQNRGVTRCYLANLFPGQGRFAPLAPRPEGCRLPASGPGPGPAPLHRPRTAA